MLDVYMLYALPSIYNKALSTFKRILKARIRVFGRLVLFVAQIRYSLEEKIVFRSKVTKDL